MSCTHMHIEVVLHMFVSRPGLRGVDPAQRDPVVRRRVRPRARREGVGVQRRFPLRALSPGAPRRAHHGAHRDPADDVDLRHLFAHHPRGARAVAASGRVDHLLPAPRGHRHARGAPRRADVLRAHLLRRGPRAAVAARARRERQARRVESGVEPRPRGHAAARHPGAAALLHVLRRVPRRVEARLEGAPRPGLRPTDDCRRLVPQPLPHPRRRAPPPQNRLPLEHHHAHPAHGRQERDQDGRGAV